MKIAVALSGGVDSFAAALLLVRGGHDVVAVTMSLGVDVAGSAGADRFRGSVERARAAADALGIGVETVDVGSEFGHAVVGPFVEEYARGRTPNPCVACNREVKFGALLDAAVDLGAAALATGHYARVLRPDPSGPWVLARGRDAARDQSYFLYRLTQRELARVIFPVGGLVKDEVRAIARDSGFAVEAVGESRDICFAQPGQIEALLRERAPGCLEPGPIEGVDGTVLGEHRGIGLYTVGQRSGLGLSRPAPTYVLRIVPERRAVVVGSEADLLSGSLRAEDLSWVAGEPPAERFAASAKIRLASEPAACAVEVRAGEADVRFDRPQRAVAPGQSVVFYRGERVLGGGIITEPGRP